MGQERWYDPIAGKGGFINVAQYDSNGKMLKVKAAFDVEEYRIERILKNSEFTHSGIPAGEAWARQGEGFTWAASVAWNPAQHIEMLIGSPRYVGLIFWLGDPDQYEANQAKSYRASRALLDRVIVINNAKGREPVRIEVYGTGSSVLWGYTGESPVQPVWEW